MTKKTLLYLLQKFLPHLVLICSLSLPLIGHTGLRKYCRSDFKACKKNSFDKQELSQCRLRKVKCLNSHLRLSCLEIYGVEAKKYAKKREKTLTTTAIVSSTGVALSASVATVALISAGPQALLSIPFFMSISLANGIIYALSKIARDEEVIYALSFEDIDYYQVERQQKKSSRKRLRRYLGKKSFSQMRSFLGKPFQEGLKTGLFCQNYPKLYKLKEAVQYAQQFPKK